MRALRYSWKRGSVQSALLTHLKTQCLFVQLVASDLFVLHAHIERCEFCEVLRRKLKRVLEAQRCQLKMVRTLGQPRSPINPPGVHRCSVVALATETRHEEESRSLSAFLFGSSVACSAPGDVMMALPSR